MDRRDCWRGQRVVWTHAPRGGHGFVLRIPAQIVRIAKDRRVVIALECAAGRRVAVSAARLEPWRRYRHREHLISATQPEAAAAARAADERDGDGG